MEKSTGSNIEGQNESTNRAEITGEEAATNVLIALEIVCIQPK